MARTDTADAIETDPRITIDDRGVRVRTTTGIEEGVTWHELTEVTVQTTADGPWGNDFFFILRSAEASCVVPGASTSIQLLLDRLGVLPGFDPLAVIDATGSDEEATFVCWRRET